MAANKSDDPATIQQDVESTQDAMGDTIQKLEDRLSPRKFAQSLLSDENSDTAREAWEVVRRNPVPVAMIGVGAAWLFAASDAPMIRRWREELKARFRGAINERASGAAMHARSAPATSGGPPPPAGEAYDRRLDPDEA
jgi:hypothetical protein